MYSIIKCYLRHILAVCVVSLCVMTGTAASSVKLDVDWPQFMSCLLYTSDAADE